MAITFIYSIKATGEKSLNYGKENKSSKILEKKNVKNNSIDSLEYIMRDKRGNTYKLSSEYMNKMKNYISYDEIGNVTFHTVKTSLNCSIDTAYKEWEHTRNNANKTRGNSGNLQYCIVQNFGIELDPRTANEIGIAFASKYLSDYQCVVSTHINTGHVHNHIEFNATSFINGKKFNDNLKAIGDIRKISDKICKDYELAILENTKDFNYVIYKDVNGRTKVYEPTERKNQIKEGDITEKNDYRNTEQYKLSLEYTNNHLKIIRKDIDKLLPHAISYEDLLQQLKNVGYEIKDKTKRGEWRKFVSFKLSEWDKYTRDCSLGEQYERENLSYLISKNLSKTNENPSKLLENSITFDDNNNQDIFSYGRIVIEDIDDANRYKRSKETFEKVERNDIEKYIILDTKKLNKEVNVIIKDSMFKKRDNIQVLAEGSKRQQYLIDRINSNLKTLKFVEERELRSFEQITDIVKTLYEKRNICYGQLNMIGMALKKANADIVIIEKYNSLIDTITANSSKSDYIQFEKDNDIKLLKTYEDVLKQKTLLDIENQQEFKKNYYKYNNTFLKLSKALKRVNKNIQDYDDCIFNLNLVDRKHGNRYTKQITNYYHTKENYKISNNQTDIKEKGM